MLLRIRMTWTTSILGPQAPRPPMGHCSPNSSQNSTASLARAAWEGNVTGGCLRGLSWKGSWIMVGSAAPAVHASTRFSDRPKASSSRTSIPSILPITSTGPVRVCRTTPSMCGPRTSATRTITPVKRRAACTFELFVDRSSRMTRPRVARVRSLLGRRRSQVGMSRPRSVVSCRVPPQGPDCAVRPSQRPAGVATG